MLRELQQRSTLSCTDRTRKERGDGGPEETRVPVENGRAAGPALECSAQVFRALRACVCVFRDETWQCVRLLLRLRQGCRF